MNEESGTTSVPGGASTLDPNSADFWLPRLSQVAIAGEAPPFLLLPATRVVPYDHQALVAHLNGEPWGGMEALVDAVWGAVWGTARDPWIPAFLRTDLASAKHDGPASYLLTSKEQTRNAICRTAEDNELKFWPFGPFPRSFLVRRWLNLNHGFRAFGHGVGGGHRIANEWRLFADPYGVRCEHFYWPAETIVNPDRENWRPILAALAKRQPSDYVRSMAQKAATALSVNGEPWSIDFAEDTSGIWWLIDVAQGESSWHPEHE